MLFFSQYIHWYFSFCGNQSLENFFYSNSKADLEGVLFYAASQKVAKYSSLNYERRKDSMVVAFSSSHSLKRQKLCQLNFVNKKKFVGRNFCHEWNNSWHLSTMVTSLALKHFPEHWPSRKEWGRQKDQLKNFRTIFHVDLQSLRKGGNYNLTSFFYFLRYEHTLRIFRFQNYQISLISLRFTLIEKNRVWSKNDKTLL